MIKVLIVEDDPMVAQFNKIYLNQIGGFELIGIASSINAALEILHQKKINLILLDISIHGGNGLELLSQIRKMDIDVDVIFVTASRDIATIKKALKYGAVDYLIKPFEFDRFNSALSDYINGHKFITHKDELNQEELDNLFLNKKSSCSFAPIPKGLDRNTLKKVWSGVQQFKNNYFSTEELANYIGISRVSIRKYLEFFTEIKSLKMDIEYGSVGRPIYKYMCINPELNNYF